MSEDDRPKASAPGVIALGVLFGEEVNGVTCTRHDGPESRRAENPSEGKEPITVDGSSVCVGGI
jgi:hypothetical protein